MKSSTRSPTGTRSRFGLAPSLVALAACVLLSMTLFPSSSARAGAPQPPADDAAPIVVLAAASMGDVLPRVGARWEADGGRPVKFSFAGSSRLARQLIDGAPGDVYVSANSRWMQELDDKGMLAPRTRRQFLSNELVWVVPSALAAPPSSVDAVEPATLRRLALAGESVPAGIYANAALEATDLAEPLAGKVVRGDNVRAALEWVARGEADAGVVYRTDALAESDVHVAFSFPPSTHPPIAYEAAALAESDQQQAARAFVDYLSTPSAKALFEQAGFASMEVADDAATASTPFPRGDQPQAEPAVDVWSAVRLSLLVGLWCAMLGLLPAIGLGWLLARREFPGKSLVSTLTLAPLALPPVVTGFLLLRLFGRDGFIGGLLTSVGLEIPFSTAGAIIAAFTVGLPMYVLAARNAFEAVDSEYEEVSLTMGHAPLQTFWRVTLPLAAPGLAAGAVLMFARAIGEFGATTVLAGNLEGETRTISLAVYTLLESPSGAESIQVLVGASVALSFLAMLGYERLSRCQRRRTEVRSDG